MPKPLLIRSEIHPYHVSSRCNNREFFPIPIQDVWEIMTQRLQCEIKEQTLAIHAFVLMNNHFHLLCHTPKANLDLIMHRLLKETSKRINHRSAKINHLWGGPYKWSLIENQAYYYQVYRYIYQNPIRAGICDRVEHYPYSTLFTQPFPLHSCIPLMFGGIEGELIWLNERFDKADQEIIKSGLKKSNFDIAQAKLKNFIKLKLPS